MHKAAENRIGSDFTTGDITKLIIGFMTPFLLANLLTDLYNMVDMIIVGKFVGSTGQAAVTLGGKLLTLCTGVSIGLSAGGQIYISQETGAKEPREEISATIGTLFSALGVLSCVLGIICFTLSEPILTVLKTPTESYDAAVSYFRITSIGMPLLFGYNAVSAVLRGMGDATRPLLFIAVAALSNLVLDLVFVLWFDMGAPGTALATVIGQGIAFLFSVVYLYRRRNQFDFDFKPASFQIKGHKLSVMMKIGVPTALQTVLIHGTQLIVIRYVNDFGIAAIDVYGIIDKIVVMCALVTQSVKSAGGAIVGQNIGAGHYERVVETLHVSLRITVAVSVVISVVTLLFPKPIFNIFSNDPEVLSYAPQIMLVSAVGFLMSALMGSYDIITTGTGNAALSFLAGVLDGVVFRLALCWLFGIRMNMGVVGFYMGNSFARIGPIMVHMIYFHSGAWKHKKRLID